MSSEDALAQLAVHGGSPLRTDPWPERGLIGPEEKAAVTTLFDQAIATGRAPGYNGAPEEAYCQAFATQMGGGYADAVSSGTAGVYTALRALDLPAFSEVIVGAINDPGGIMPIALLNCIPVIADTAPGSFSTGPAQVEALITPLTSAILVPHIAGEPADIAGIVALAQARGIPVIEDASQTHEATLHGRRIGTFGRVSVFSTMFGKHYCTGGQGGLVYTADEATYWALRRASDRGKPFGLPPGSSNAIASLNLNLTDLAAVIGLEQLKKLPAVSEARRAVVRCLRAGLAGARTVSLPEPLPGAEPSYWFLRVRYHAANATCDKATFCQALQTEGLPVMTDYRAMPHTMDWFVQRRVFGTPGYPWTSPDYHGDRDRAYPCPNAVQAIAEHFVISIHEGWGPREIADTLAIIDKVETAYAQR